MRKNNESKSAVGYKLASVRMQFERKSDRLRWLTLWSDCGGDAIMARLPRRELLDLVVVVAGGGR
jgi:hypothetical protein